MTVYTGGSSTGRKSEWVQIGFSPGRPKFEWVEMGFSPGRPKFEWVEICRLTVGVRSSNVSISLSVLSLAVTLSDCIIISLPWWTVSHN